MVERRRTQPEIGAQWLVYTSSLHLRVGQHAEKHSGSKAERVGCID